MCARLINCILAGTVLDRAIVSPREQDFFLISQAAKLVRLLFAQYAMLMQQKQCSMHAGAHVAARLARCRLSGTGVQPCGLHDMLSIWSDGWRPQTPAWVAR